MAAVGGLKLVVLVFILIFFPFVFESGLEKIFLGLVKF